MLRRRLLILATFLVFSVGFFVLSRDVYAQVCGQSCDQSSECSSCCNPGDTSCSYSCLSNAYNAKRCTVTRTDPVANCSNWCGWSACSGGYMTRDCCVTGNNSYQIAACSTPTTAGGGPGGPGGGGNPVGNHDGTSCALVNGWACDSDNYSQALQIHFYTGGPAGGGGTYIGATTANVTREPAVASICGGVAAHGFSWSLPTAYRTGANTIYAYAINIGTGTGNPLLSSSPRSNSCPAVITNTPTPVTCTAPPVPTTVSPSGSQACRVVSPSAYTFTWNAVAGAASYDLRINDLSSPWDNTCGVVNANDFCGDVTGTSRSFNLIAGHTYEWWVRSQSSCGSLSAPSSVRTVDVSPLCSSTPAPTLPPATSAPTTAPGQCTSPRPVDPPAVSCGNPGTVYFVWNDVGGVNEYNLIVQQLVGGVWSNVVDYGWDPASTYGSACNGDGVGNCNRLENRPPGVYRSRIRARNTTGTCTASNFSDSGQATISTCSTSSSPTPVAGCTAGSAVFSPTSANMGVGTSRTFSLTVSDNPPGCSQDGSFTRSNTDIAITSANPDTGEPFTVTARCDAAGTSVLTGRARNGGAVLASDSVSVTCNSVVGATSTPTPTPIPPVVACTRPAPRDPPATVCGNPGQVTWEWDDVANVNQYNLVIRNGSGLLVQDYGWLSPGSFGAGCNGDGVGTCSRTDTRPAGNYYSQIRARNTNVAICTTSAFSNSELISLYACSTISLNPNPVVINGVGSSSTLFATANPPTNFTGGQSMSFNIGDTTIASINPNPKPLSTTTASVTSLAVGDTTYSARITDDFGNLIQRTDGQIQVLNPNPWCQARNGDIIVVDDLTCPIPASCIGSCEASLITSDPAQSDGIVVVGGSVDQGTGTSDVVNDAYAGTQYDYNYFINKAFAVSPTPVSGPTNVSPLTTATLSQGYHWARAGSTLSLTGGDIGDNRVVLFVNGDLNISGPITLNDGRGFFMAIVSGNINVNGNVGGASDTTPDLEGLYFANGTFNTENPASDPDSQLHVRGSVAADAFSMTRDLPDNSTTPAEIFEFGPDQLLQVPALLSRKQVIWREVAP